MKRTFFSLILVFFSLTTTAQTMVKYGTVSMKNLLVEMPEYKEVETQMASLRTKYEAETRYNEEGFKRLFTEFLQGQKEFPQNILLKRQRDLQEAMEKGIAFREEADSLLKAAREEMVRPLRKRVEEAVRAVGMERGYEAVLNTDLPSHPFLHPSLTEDAMPFVRRKLVTLP